MKGVVRCGATKRCLVADAELECIPKVIMALDRGLSRGWGRGSLLWFEKALCDEGTSHPGKVVWCSWSHRWGWARISIRGLLLWRVGH